MSRYPYFPSRSPSLCASEAVRKMEELKELGCELEPIGPLADRKRIASSFWGQAWCRHVEAFGDYESRLPRGRSYVRAGAVLHLGIEPGRVEAWVMGGSLYHVEVEVSPLPAPRWQALRGRCQGRIGSLIGLLRGEIQGEVLKAVTDREDGLFPRPGELKVRCTCPDWAGLCKHGAAVLYGVGVRFDAVPEVFFSLRGVDFRELMEVGPALVPRGSGRRRLDAVAVKSVFGIEMEVPEPETQAPSAPAAEPSPTPVKEPSGVPSRPARVRKLPLQGPAGEAFEPTPAHLLALRQRLGLSRSGLALRLGISVAHVIRWEQQKQGELKMSAPVLRRLKKWASEP